MRHDFLCGRGKARFSEVLFQESNLMTGSCSTRTSLTGPPRWFLTIQPSRRWLFRKLPAATRPNFWELSTNDLRPRLRTASPANEASLLLRAPLLQFRMHPVTPARTASALECSLNVPHAICQACLVDATDNPEKPDQKYYRRLPPRPARRSARPSISRLLPDDSFSGFDD